MFWAAIAVCWMFWCVSSSYWFPHTVDVKLQRHSFWNFLLHFFHYCWSGRGGRWVQGPGSRRSESHAIKINLWITWTFFWSNNINWTLAVASSFLVPDSWIFTNKVDHFISASFFEFSPIAFRVSEAPTAIPWVCPKNMNKRSRKQYVCAHAAWLCDTLTLAESWQWGCRLKQSGCRCWLRMCATWWRKRSRASHSEWSSTQWVFHPTQWTWNTHCRVLTGGVWGFDFCTWACICRGGHQQWQS